MAGSPPDPAGGSDVDRSDAAGRANKILAANKQKYGG